ncbi:antitoxin [Phytoactinopolyspora sp. XMNu-373]|uniref:Antitoxin n=2 Tax=Phytoactinopolyspora mesophila TaxID=2650750 RepID=A0A7K3LX58_9ACTN|nr:antitoxin [Phytoactinopolyspora mesophila]
MGREGTQMLDRMAEAEGASREEVARRLLDRALAGAADDAAADLTALEASFGVCPEIEIMPRETSERGRHLVEMWQITP